MFNNLINFAYKRNTKEAVGFYIAYLVLIILTAVLLAGVLGSVTGNSDNFNFGVRIGGITAAVACFVLSMMIVKSKKLTVNFLYIALVLLSGILALFGGALIGLIPTAYLSTR